MLARAYRKMVAAGMSVEDIAEMLEIMEEGFAQPPPSVGPTAGALRQRRYRERKASPVASQASPNATSDDLSPKDTQPLSEPTSLDQNPNPPPYSPPALSKPDAFARFWQAYPSKVQKRTAETAFRRALGRADEATILAGVERAKLGRKWREGIIANPATWLNGDCWLDEVAGVPSEHHASPAEWPETRWRAAVEHFAESRRWSDACGPSPAELHCRAPPNVLAEFGFAPLEGGADVVPFRASAA